MGALSRWLQRGPAQPSCRPSPYRPWLEPLEVRDVPATGSFDLTFAGTGYVVTPFDRGGANNDAAEAVAVQADGKMVAAGYAQRDTTNHDFAVVRYNRDGSLDTSFGSGGKVLVAFDLGGPNDDRARAVALQPNGRIVVAGFAADALGPRFAAARLNADGTLDTTFDGDGRAVVGILTGATNALAIQQPDGGILLAGTVLTLAGHTDFGVARLLSGGQADLTFGNGGVMTVAFDVGGTNNDVVEAIAVAPDGGFVVAGTAEASPNASVVAVARPNAAGFGDGGKVLLRYNDIPGRHAGRGLAVQADGKIVVTGEAPHEDSSRIVSALGLVRLTPGGGLDAAFAAGAGRLVTSLNENLMSETTRPEAVLVQPDGKIVVAGTSRFFDFPTDMFVSRFLMGGGVDTTYRDINGYAGMVYDLAPGSARTHDQGLAVALSADGIVVAGTALTAANSTDFALLRAVRDNWVVASADWGGPPQVKVFTPTGTLLYAFAAFGLSFTGGVRTALADITGDGAPEIFTAPGPGGEPIVNIWDGFTFQLLRQVQVFGTTFTGGVHLAAGDVLGDAAPELLVSPDAGGDPFVNIFDPRTAALLRQVLVYGSTFTGGVRVAVGKDWASGRPSLYAAPGPGGLPVVNSFDAATGNLVRQQQVYGDGFTGGVFLGVELALMESFNQSLHSNLIVGPGTGGDPVVNVFGAVVLRRQYPIAEQGFTGGVRVAAFRQRSGFSLADIVAGLGPGGPPRIKVLEAHAGSIRGDFLAFEETMTAGVLVSAAVR